MGKVFGAWFNTFEHFSRVYDRKVTVLGLAAIFRLPAQQWPAEIQSSAKTILLSCVKLIHDAAEHRQQKGDLFHTFDSISSPFSSASLVDDEAKEFTFADEALASVIRGHLEKSKAVGVQDEDNSDCDLDDFDPDVRGCLSV